MLETLGANLNDEIKSSPYYENKVQFTLQEVNKTGNQELINAVKNIGNNFSEETTFEQLGNYMDQIDVIRDSYKTSKGTTILASQVERSQMINENSETQVSNDYGVSVKTEIDDSSDIKFINPETGENFGEKIIGVGTGVVTDVTDAWEKGKEAYEEAKNENEKKEQEKLQEQITEFQEEMMKLEFSGNLSNEEFEKQLDLILKNDKFKDIGDDLKSDIKNNLLELKGTKEVELKKVNDLIDSLYDPNKPNSIVYKDENGNEKVVEFNSPEEAQNFIKNFKILAEEEFNNSWGDAIYDFFGDASEWVLPLTETRKIINQKFELFSSDTPWLLVEAYIWYSIIAILGSGVIASLKRRGGDILGSINTKNKKYNFSAEAVTALKTMTPLDINSEAGKDFLELKNRTETLNKLYEYAETIADIQEKHKVLKEIKELDKKFFLRRSDTFDLKALKIMERLGKGYDFRVVMFEGARIRLPVFHRIPRIGQWGWVQTISKEGIQIRKSEDFVNYIKAKDIENRDGLKRFYDIDKDNNFTLKQEKLDGVLAVAELEWKKAGISDADITKYKKNIEEYIKNLSTKKVEHTVSLSRNIQLFIERPSEMNNMIENDIRGKIELKIEEIKGKIGSLGVGEFVTIHPIKKRELNRQLSELEILERYINGNNWFGTVSDFDSMVNDIINNKGKAEPRILSGFTSNNRFLDSTFKIVSDIEVSKENFGKFLGEKISSSDTSSRLDKINTLIDYYLPTDIEEKTRDEFNKLQNKNFKNIDDYKDELKRILGGITDIDIKLSSVSKIENSYKLINYDNIGNFINKAGDTVKTDFTDSGNIKNAIIQHYGLDIGKDVGMITDSEFSRIEREIKKISDSLADGNNYTIGQLTYLIEKIKSGDSYDSLKNIDWFSVPRVDLGKTGESMKKPFIDEKQRLEEDKKRLEEEKEKKDIEEKDKQEKQKQRKESRKQEIKDFVDNNVDNKLKTLEKDEELLKKMKDEYVKNGQNLQVINDNSVLKDKYGIRTTLLAGDNPSDYIEKQIDNTIIWINNEISKINSTKEHLNKNINSGKSLYEINKENFSNEARRSFITIDILFAEGKISESRKDDLILKIYKEYKKKDYLDFVKNVEKELGYKIKTEAEIKKFIEDKKTTIKSLLNIDVEVNSKGKIILKESGRELTFDDLKTKTSSSVDGINLLSVLKAFSKAM